MDIFLQGFQKPLQGLRSTSRTKFQDFFQLRQKIVPDNYGFR